MNNQFDLGHLKTLDDVAEHFLQQLRNGLRPTLEFYQLRFPQWSAEIGELFPTLADLEDLDPLNRSLPSGPPAVDIPEQLGDYLIRREIGRGGMGVVYEAEHKTMQRRVALKLMPISHHDDHRQRRFLREARAAGQLHHTNIVPVFEVGQSHGYCYYAMQFIDGHNLDVIIDELRKMAGGDIRTGMNLPPSPAATTLVRSSEDLQPGLETPNSLTGSDATGESTGGSDSATRDSGSSEWSRVGEASDSYFRRVAKVGIQIAEALQFAHSQGVLHRDIKPSNLILDNSGNVWVTDFGLAKDGSDDLTHTGDIVGTLRYMAPERFQQDADVASEVYSLGLTLYELCTLRPAFDATDKLKLIQQIQSHDPVSPRRLRPEIPVDLETVIAKSIAREARLRYPSARLMAEDLQRFLADRPVLARRVTSVEKLFRWARRNRAAAALASCLLVIAILVTGGSLFLAKVSRQHAAELQVENRRVIDEKTKTENALAAAERSRRASQAHLYYVHLEKAQAILENGRQGQRFDCLASIQQAADIIPKLSLSDEQAERRFQSLRTVAASAISQWDLKTLYRWKTPVGRISSVAFDFTNQRSAQADAEGNLLIRAFGKEETQITLPSPGKPAWLAQFSPNGKYLLARYHDEVYLRTPFVLLWDVDQQSVICRIESPSLPAWHVFSQNSRRFAVVRNDRSIEIRNTESGQLVMRLVPNHLAEKILFTSGGRELAILNNAEERVEFHQLETKSPQVQYVDLGFSSSSMAWNDSTGQLAVSDDHRIVIIDTRNPDSEPIVLSDHQSRVVRLWLHPRQKLLLSSSWDGTTRMFDLTRRKETLRVEGKRLVFSGFDPSGEMIGFTGELQEFGVWQLPERVATSASPSKVGKSAHGNGLFLPGHPEIVLQVTPMGIDLWNHRQWRRVATIPVPDVERIRLTTDSQIMVGGRNGVQVWHFDRKSDKGQGISLSRGETLWDEPVRDFDYDPVSGQLAIGAGGRILTWDPATEERKSIGVHAKLSQLLWLDGNRQILSSTWQGRGLKLWDAVSGDLLEDLAPDSLNAAIASCSDKRHWTIVTGSEMIDLGLSPQKSVVRKPRDKADGWAGSIAYAQDPALLAMTYSRYVPQLVDAESRQPRAFLESPHRFSLGGIHWSDDDRFLSIADDGNLLVWDMDYLNGQWHQMGLHWSTPRQLEKTGTNLPPSL